MNALELMIRDEIRVRGPMRFDRYMELALYHPAHGYYTGIISGRIGRSGDFFTSVSVGPLFGRLLARQAAQMWQLLGQPNSFWIIEQGAHEGQLAIDILEECRRSAPELFEAVRYRIIEPSESAREVQKRRVTEMNLSRQVDWIASLKEGSSQKIVGLFFSNELVDAFPVRLIRRHQQAWNERHVGLEADDVLSWTDLPIADPELRSVMEELPLPQVEGYVTEINLRARSWMREAAKILDRGYVLTIDYGFPASIYYAPFRVGGTLTTYRRHRRDDDVLVSPGEGDITAHVDFSALARAGEAAGLQNLALVDQQHFLMGVAHDELSGQRIYSDGISKQMRAWSMLTHPEHLGSRFQVLVQAKDVEGELDGLRYARPGRLD